MQQRAMAVLLTQLIVVGGLTVLSVRGARKDIALHGKKLELVEGEMGLTLRLEGEAASTKEAVTSLAERQKVFGAEATASEAANESMFTLAKHGDHPSPRPADTQSHHGVMSAWMKKHFPGYTRSARA